MITNEAKENIISEIKSLIGANETPKFLSNFYWLELDSGIWLLSQTQQNFIQNLSSNGLEKKLKYAGIFIGKIRKNFGLSMESLYFLQPYMTRFVIIKGKTLQKYLYGKTTIVTVNKDDINNLELKKVIVMTPEKQPVGISSFTVLEERKENNKILFSLKLEPITDLGMFLRKERTMFE